MENDIFKKVTSIDIKNLSEGTRLSYTYSSVDANGKIIDSNAKGSFVVLDNMTVKTNVDGVETEKNVMDAINVLFRAANDKLS